MTADAFQESIEDLYDHAPCGYLSSLPDGTIVRVNATFLEWTGYGRDDLLGGRRFQELLTIGGRIYHETHVAPLLAMHGEVREIAVEIRRADGSRLPALVNAVVRHDAAGTPLLVRTTVFDASDRRRYELELLSVRDRERAARERTERLQALTAAIAAAAGADAIAAAVVQELAAALDAPGVALVASTGRELARTGDVAGAEVHVPVQAGAELLVRPARALAADELAFLRACAELTGVALGRAQLYDEQRDVALRLQRSMIAGEPLTDPRYDLAVAYLPALAHLEVGGDWHDAFPLPGGRVALVVGDVVGRGLDAAAAMGQLRSAVRALAAAGAGPAALIDHLDTFVDQIQAARFATLAYVAFDPATGDAVAAVAGHPPPVVVAEAGAVPELYMGGRSTPVGVRVDGGRAQAGFRLGRGGLLVLYTDGLVERRKEPLDAGLERLRAAVAASADRSPAALARGLPDVLGAAGAEDDVCLLALRRAA